MELTCDWRNFQSLFFPRKRSVSQPEVLPDSPIYQVTERGVVLTIASDGEEGLATAGRSSTETCSFERKLLDQWLYEASALSGYYEQIEHLRTQAQKSLSSQKSTLSLRVPSHFLLDSLQGWWGKILPSSFGLYLHFEGAPSKDFFLLFRRGKLSSFHEPDLSSMNFSNQSQSGEVVKFLSEKYLVPVQGMFLQMSEWLEWAESDHPWPEIAKSLRANRLRLVPFRWSLATLAATRAYFGV